MKALVIASVASMIDQFNIPNIEIMQKLGYAVEVACNFREGNTCDDKKIVELKEKLTSMNVRFYDINFFRDVTNISENLVAYRQLKKIFKENRYKIVHCHAPISGILGRIVANKYRKNGTKVIYTAHGFHFYKGAPLKNWLLYFPVEWFMSFFTDVLITINREDYRLARNCMHPKRVEYVPGVGIDRSKFTGNVLTGEEKTEIRNSLGVKDGETMILSVGELIPRKNHEIIIKALHKLKNKKIKYFICGQGELNDYLQSLINDLNLTENVKLLGFRTDISALCCSADLFAFPSLQEGLPVALMEAMASGLPCVVSRIRGNVDLISENKNGCFFSPMSEDGAVKAVRRVIKMNKNTVKDYNMEVLENYSIESVNKKMVKIYRRQSVKGNK